MKELAFLFLKLGTIAFGGPAAHVALMEDEVVRRKGWLSRQEFLDLLGAANLLPGPSSTELAIFIGYKREGLRGLALAGVCFILPAMLIVWMLARFYVQFGSFPVAIGVLYGIKAVIIAVIVQAVLSLSRTAIKTWYMGVVAAVALFLFATGTNALLVLLLGGLTSLLYDRFSSLKNRRQISTIWVVCLTAGLVGANAFAEIIERTTVRVPLTRLFLFFIKLGSVVFGSGYVLLAFLQTDLVDRFHWLTQSQLLDAVAVGQFTPGPVFTTVTFIGYLLAGNQGAILATIGIFLPAFLFVSVGGLLIPKIKHSPMATSFLNGVNAASLALMTFVVFQLGRSALTDFTTWALAILSIGLLLKFRINSLWLILCGAIVGILKIKMLI